MPESGERTVRSMRAQPSTRGYAMNEETKIRQLAARAREASAILAHEPTSRRDGALRAMAAQLRADAPSILEANAADVSDARDGNTPDPLVDRLLLDESRIEGMASALEDLAGQRDPIGEVIAHRTLDSGVDMEQVRVPLGVVAMIYEARPNVTADAAGLCIKTANACILRGGSLALRSGAAIADTLRRAIASVGLPVDAIIYIDDPTHEATDELMKMRDLVDVLIPRGSAKLISCCVENSSIPVIETGTGNCHIYLHAAADASKALDIVLNAKTQRPGVCNAAESLLVDEKVADALLIPILAALSEKGVILHCDERSLALALSAGIPSAIPGTDEDWGREYLDLEMSVKYVDGVEEAVRHINLYGTRHSEAIVSEDPSACEYFLEHVDASTVYSNASTRFTDGGEFGLGAEIGISTQKLHARGPMGLDALTSTKFVCRGDGQVRA